MPLRDTLARALEQFSDRGLRLDTSMPLVATFAGVHPAMGDLTVRTSGVYGNFSVTMTIGEIFGTHFTNYDTHLADDERAVRVTKEVLGFLDALFSDRVLSWRATDGRNSGWRERGESGAREPMVLDNRVYYTYLWSGPLGLWQAIPAILGRGQIQTDREYEILAGHLDDPAAEHFDAAQRELATRLVQEYDRFGHAGKNSEPPTR